MSIFVEKLCSITVVPSLRTINTCWGPRSNMRFPAWWPWTFAGGHGVKWQLWSWIKLNFYLTPSLQHLKYRLHKFKSLSYCSAPRHGTLTEKMADTEWGRGDCYASVRGTEHKKEIFPVHQHTDTQHTASTPTSYECDECWAQRQLLSCA